MCKFQSLYFEDDGYVVRCSYCGHFEVGFSSTMLSLTENDFQHFVKHVKRKSDEASLGTPAHCKVVIVKTPSPGICIMLTRNEARRFCEILDEADTEMKALNLMRLFNP